MSTLQIVLQSISLACFVVILFMRPLVNLWFWLTWDRPMEKALRASEERRGYHERARRLR
jgi:hypothetical protein